MPECPKDEKERRSTPRFNCDGQAKISLLPSDGIFLPGKIRDLSLAGCLLDTKLPIEAGTRAEVVVRVNAASFRAVGIVKALRDDSAVGIEFVRLSAGGRELLADLVSELARLRVVIDNLMFARREMDAKSFRRQMEAGKLHAALFATRYPFLKTTLSAEISEQEEPAPAPKQVTTDGPRVIPVDLFG
jgi:PilZ domain